MIKYAKSEPRVSRGEILDEAKAIITKDRNATHGEPEDSFAPIAELWTVYIRNKIKRIPRGLDQAIAPDMLVEITSYDVARMMVLFKAGRAMVNENNPDNYLDEAGYSAISGSLMIRESQSFGWITKRPMPPPELKAKVNPDMTVSALSGPGEARTASGESGVRVGNETWRP